MHHRSRERLDCLAGKHCAHRLDRARDHHRDFESDLIEQSLGPDERGFDVAGVLLCFDDQNVSAAGHKSRGLIVEVLDQLIECDAAGDRNGFGGWPHRTGDESRFFRSRIFSSGLARQSRCCFIQLLNVILERVLGEHD